MDGKDMQRYSMWSRLLPIFTSQTSAKETANVLLCSEFGNSHYHRCKIPQTEPTTLASRELWMWHLHDQPGTAESLLGSSYRESNSSPVFYVRLYPSKSSQNSVPSSHGSLLQQKEGAGGRPPPHRRSVRPWWRSPLVTKYSCCGSCS